MNARLFSSKSLLSATLGLIFVFPVAADDRDKRRSKESRPSAYRLENRDTRNIYRSSSERPPVPVEVRRNDSRRDNDRRSDSRRDDNRRNDSRRYDNRRSGEGPTERERDQRQAYERRLKEAQERQQRNSQQRRYYSNGRYYYDPYFRRPYYGNTYYSGGYYYARPATTVAIGVGSGYSTYNTSYIGTYEREDNRPIYRGQAISEASEAPLEVEVQRALSRLGYYNGSIDGDIGPASRRAIANFQRENDLPVTGRIDSRLIAALELE